MADIRINALATTAASTASDDFLAVDGSANGTRKLNAFSPTFGGNLTVSGTDIKINNSTGYLYVDSGSSLTGMVLSRTNNILELYTTNVARLTISSAGNTTLAGNLTVSGTQITNTGAAESTGNIRLSHASGGKVIRWASSNYNVDLYQSGDNDILRARVANFAISSDPTFATNYTTIAAGNIVTTGNLTVSGTGASTVNGNLLITGTTNYTRIRRDDTIIDFTNAAQSAYANAQIIANNLHLKGNNGTGIYVNSSGNGLFGTTTDSANGRIQLATHTTSAGGIGFGTDTSLYRAAAGILAIDGTSTAFAKLRLLETGSLKFQLESVAGDVTLATLTAGKTIKFNTGNDTLALTLDSSQNATFAGAVTVNGATASGINASGSFDWIASRANTSSSASYQYKTGATLNWYHGLRGLANNNWYLFNNATSANTLIFDAATDAATFAGTVTTKGSTLSAINNTNVSTTATDIAIATSVGGLYFVTGYNTSGGAQGTWLLMMRGSNVTTISSDNNTGLTVTYSVSAGKLQAATASGTIALIATAITR
jgi:filamentous hemagglutinin